jgi:hypothetical protein
MSSSTISSILSTLGPIDISALSYSDTELSTLIGLTPATDDFISSISADEYEPFFREDYLSTLSTLQLSTLFSSILSTVRGEDPTIIKASQELALLNRKIQQLDLSYNEQTEVLNEKLLAYRTAQVASSDAAAVLASTTQRVNDLSQNIVDGISTIEGYSTLIGPNLPPSGQSQQGGGAGSTLTEMYRTLATSYSTMYLPFMAALNQYEEDMSNYNSSLQGIQVLSTIVVQDTASYINLSTLSQDKNTRSTQTGLDYVSALKGYDSEASTLQGLSNVYIADTAVYLQAKADADAAAIHADYTSHVLSSAILNQELNSLYVDNLSVSQQLQNLQAFLAKGSLTPASTLIVNGEIEYQTILLQSTTAAISRLGGDQTTFFETISTLANQAVADQVAVFERQAEEARALRVVVEDQLSTLLSTQAGLRAEADELDASATSTLSGYPALLALSEQRAQEIQDALSTIDAYRAAQLDAQLNYSTQMRVSEASSRLIAEYDSTLLGYSTLVLDVSGLNAAQATIDRFTLNYTSTNLAYQLANVRWNSTTRQRRILAQQIDSLQANDQDIKYSVLYGEYLYKKTACIEYQGLAETQYTEILSKFTAASTLGTTPNPYELTYTQTKSTLEAWDPILQSYIDTTTTLESFLPVLDTFVEKVNDRTTAMIAAVNAEISLELSTLTQTQYTALQRSADAKQRDESLYAPLVKRGIDQIGPKVDTSNRLLSSILPVVETKNLASTILGLQA